MTLPTLLKIIIIVVTHFSLSAQAQELVVYTMPSPVPYNWRSPHTLFVSYMENLMKHTPYPGHQHPMGHMIVELRDSSHYALVGAAPRHRAEFSKAVLMERYGLGTLLTSYTGLLETPEDNMHQLLDRYKNGDIAYVRFLISEETFSRLWQYLNEYRERGYDSIYNGNNRPREGTGAGCSAFAVGFIEVGGLLDSNILDQWQIRLDIQDKLIGGREREVSIMRMAFTQRWAKKTRQPYQSIVYYEPNFVFNWITTKYLNRDNSFPYTIEKRGKSPGIVIDCRDRPTPTVEIWQDR